MSQRIRSSQLQTTDLAGAELSHLRYFYAVAQDGSFTVAAKRLRVGQPAISRAVQHLERALGVSLLERGQGRRVQLTDVGRAVYARCEIAFGELAAIRELALEARTEPRGELVLATNEHVAIHLLPSLLARMKHEMPKVVPRVFTGPADLLLPKIAAGAVELGLFFLVSPLAGVAAVTIRKEPCCIVVARDRATDERVLTSFIGSRELEDLANRRFPTVDFLRRHRPETAITLSCSSLEAHKALVLAGAGVSILPRFIVERELAAGTLEVLHPEYTFDAELQLVTLAQKKLSRAARWLVRHLR